MSHGPHSVPPNVGKWILWGLYASCVVVVLLDFTYEKHGHYAVENWPGFHGGYGFISFVGLVLTAIVLRKIISRPEGYYDDEPPADSTDSTVSDGEDAHHG